MCRTWPVKCECRIQFWPPCNFISGRRSVTRLLGLWNWLKYCSGCHPFGSPHPTMSVFTSVFIVSTSCVSSCFGFVVLALGLLDQPVLLRRLKTSRNGKCLLSFLIQYPDHCYSSSRKPTNVINNTIKWYVKCDIEIFQERHWWRRRLYFWSLELPSFLRVWRGRRSLPSERLRMCVQRRRLWVSLSSCNRIDSRSVFCQYERVPPWRSRWITSKMRFWFVGWLVNQRDSKFWQKLSCSVAEKKGGTG